MEIRFPFEGEWAEVVSGKFIDMKSGKRFVLPPHNPSAKMGTVKLAKRKGGALTKKTFVVGSRRVRKSGLVRKNRASLTKSPLYKAAKRAKRLAQKKARRQNRA